MADSLAEAIAKAELARVALQGITDPPPPVVPVAGGILAATVPVQEVLKKHEEEFKPDAWLDYSAEELYWWTHLLLKRANHRVKGDKFDKDVYDAGNYLGMYKEKLKVISPDRDPEDHPNVQSLTISLRTLKGA